MKEGLHLKFKNCKTSFIISSIYRLPDPTRHPSSKSLKASLTSFIPKTSLSSSVESLMPVSATSIDEHLEKLIDSHGLLQHVTSSTHSKGHKLVTSEVSFEKLSNKTSSASPKNFYFATRHHHHQSTELGMLTTLPFESTLSLEELLNRHAPVRKQSI